MARGDWNEVEKDTSSVGYKAGFRWRYANTTENAQRSNLDLIEVNIFARKVSGTGVWNLNNVNSSFKYTIGTTETQKTIVTKFDFRNQSNTTYYLGNSMPFKRVSGFGSSETISSIQIEVPHNVDGSAPTFKLEWTWVAGSTTIGTAVVSATLTLDPILRGSTLNEISDFNINDTITMSINKYVSSYADNLVITAGTTTIKTINNITNGTKVSFSTSEKNTIQDLMSSPQIILRFTLSTYDGSTLVGTSIQDAICNDLSQPILFSISKNATGYKLGLNGVLNEQLNNGVQVLGQLYLNSSPIIESGSNGNGKYIKYANGFMICIKEIETSLPATNKWGNLYYGRDLTTIFTFPQTFKEAPKVICDVVSNDPNNYGIIQCSERKPEITTTTYKNIGILSPDTHTTIEIKVTLYAFGFWK